MDFGFDFELILFWVDFELGFPMGFDLILSCLC